MAQKNQGNTGKNRDQSNKNPNQKQNPAHIVNNPAMQNSGRDTDYRNIRDKGHSPGGAISQNRDGDAGNYKNLDDEKDFNKAGNPKNTAHDEQTASDQIKDHARPISKYSGAEGKTMVKNVGETELHSPDLQGEQQGGNHGGGNNKGNKHLGNQSFNNPSIIQQRDQGGDYKGRKGKK